MGNAFWHNMEPSTDPPSSADIIASMDKLWCELAGAPAPDYILVNNDFLRVLTDARVVYRWRGRKYVTRPFARLFNREQANG